MKGDTVRVTVGVGGRADTTILMATKVGRTVRVKAGTGQWVTVDEMTAPSRQNPQGTPTGNRGQFLRAAVISIVEERGERNGHA